MIRIYIFAFSSFTFWVLKLFARLERRGGTANLTSGKGYWGLVLLTEGMDWDHPLPLAIKIRGVDACPLNFWAEVQAKAIANQYEMYPKLSAHSDHFIAMENLTGLTIY